jgi:hypothetical protein
MHGSGTAMQLLCLGPLLHAGLPPWHRSGEDGALALLAALAGVLQGELAAAAAALLGTQAAAQSVWELQLQLKATNQVQT